MKHLVLIVLWLALLPAASLRAEDEAIVEVVSPGGITAWLRQDASVPLVAIDFKFRGTGIVAAAKAGTETLAARMLTEGAGAWDGDAFRQVLADDAIGLAFRAGRDSFDGNLTTLTANRTISVQLLRAALTQPRLDAAALRQQKARLVAERRRSDTRPDAIAFRTWFRLAFAGHPYGQSVQGTPATVEAVEAADIRDFLDRMLTRKGLTIGVAGDINPAELGALLDEAFGNLPDHAPPPAIAPVPVLPAGLAVVPHPGPQSVVVFGQAGISRQDPDWYPALVITQILGGSTFTSRLGAEVREKRGLAYGISASLAPYRAGAILMGRTATRSAAAGETVGVIAAEWRRLATEGPTAEELVEAKTYLIGSFPLSLDSTGAIAAALVDMQIADLPRNYWSKRPAVIAAIDLPTARRVAARLLDPAALLTVAVGMPDGLTATLAVPASQE